MLAIQAPEGTQLSADHVKTHTHIHTHTHTTTTTTTVYKEGYCSLMVSSVIFLTHDMHSVIIDTCFLPTECSLSYASAQL